MHLSWLNSLLFLFATIFLVACDISESEPDKAEQHALEQVSEKFKDSNNVLISSQLSLLPTTSIFNNFSEFNVIVRNPFLPSSLEEGDDPHIANAESSQNRKKETLEYFALDQLNLKGNLQNAQGNRQALIQMPDGHIESVRIGQYIGLNQGKVVDITEHYVDIIETVSDQQGGLIQRSQRLVLNDTY